MLGRPPVGELPTPDRSSRRDLLARRVCRWALGGIVVLSLGRAVLHFAYLVGRFSTPLEAFFLESKMVHLAWRAQHGLGLYPSWHSGPYVANFFGPIYFELVGLIGKAGAVDVDGLFPIARVVTIASSAALTILLGVYCGRRWGASAGCLAALVSIGARPTVGFGVMARPDTLADLFGFAGFLLALGATRRRLAAGSLLLLLAIFTKQTTAVYLIAACLAHVWNGRRAAALGVGSAVVLSALAIVAAVTLGGAPGFGPGLVGELGTPRDLADYRRLLEQFAIFSPDLAVFALIGLVLWNQRPTRDRSLATLAIVLLITSLAAAVKKGAGLNYFLCLRTVEALALATLWTASKKAEGVRAWWLAAILAVAGVALIPSVADAWIQADSAFQQRDYLRGRAGRARMRQHRALLRLCEDPAARILTDSGLLDIHQGPRTAFADPWLFRLLVNTQRLEPSAMKSAVEEERYDWIFTTKEIMGADYRDYDFGLPISVIEPARRHYVFDGWKAGFFQYRPRGRRAP